MEKPFVDRKALAASLIGCQRDELLGFRDQGLSGVVVIAPDGSKHHLPEELLRRAQAWLVEIPGEETAVTEDVGRVSEPAIDPVKDQNGGIEFRPTGEVMNEDADRVSGQAGLSQTRLPPAESAAGVQALAGERLKPARESIKKTRRPKGPHP